MEGNKTKNERYRYLNLENDIREKLWSKADEDYKAFASSLIPGETAMMGVRLPVLRKMAAGFSEELKRTYLLNGFEDYFEELMLKGILIGNMKATIEERLKWIQQFIPKIRNWSLCDSFCSGLKFTLDHKETVWDFLETYFLSKQEFEQRFAFVMLLSYYVNEEYQLRAFERIKHTCCAGYYAEMSKAWAVSIYFVNFPDITWEFLLNHNMEKEVMEKALRKILESKAVTDPWKEKVRNLKRLTFKSIESRI